MVEIDDTRSKLLDVAGQVFAERGFELATVREICRRADVQNLASINYYFRDKNNLYIEAVRTAFKGSAEPEPLPKWPEGATPAEKLRGYITQFAATLIRTRRPTWHHLLVSRELAQPTDGCLAFIRDFARPHFEVLAGLLREVLPEVDPIRINLTALSIIGQVIHHLCARTIISLIVGPEVDQYDAATVGRHVADFSLAALGLAPPIGETP
jgi:TetR/AcrR family transcriptional regulator, regulator of cefoperazone and chloramphenicol sensitivity